MVVTVLVMVVVGTNASAAGAAASNVTTAAVPVAASQANRGVEEATMFVDGLLEAWLRSVYSSSQPVRCKLLVRWCSLHAAGAVADGVERDGTKQNVHNMMVIRTTTSAPHVHVRSGPIVVV